MSRPVAVILNDTTTRHHHGCARVMRLLTAGLEEAGLDIGLRVPARTDWTRDRAMLRAMRAAQVIVINGEGTCHDGAAAADRLLMAVDLAPNVPVALINALWQKNPPAWGDRLRRMALVVARDSRSAAEMAALLHRPVAWQPDLSLSAPAEGAAARRGLIVGDSVRHERRHALGRAAQRLGALSLPTKTLQGALWKRPLARRILWRAYHGAWTGPVPRFAMAANEGTYLAYLAGAQAHITGRFHGVCLSMLTETPFLALASVTSKVETLLQDAGLGRDRLIDDAALAALTPEAARRPFTPEERVAVRRFRALAEREARHLYAEIKGLTR